MANSRTALGTLGKPVSGQTGPFSGVPTVDAPTVDELVVPASPRLSWFGRLKRDVGDGLDDFGHGVATAAGAVGDAGQAAWRGFQGRGNAPDTRFGAASPSSAQDWQQTFNDRLQADKNLAAFHNEGGNQASKPSRLEDAFNNGGTVRDGQTLLTQGAVALGGAGVPTLKTIGGAMAPIGTGVELTAEGMRVHRSVTQDGEPMDRALAEAAGRTAFRNVLRYAPAVTAGALASETGPGAVPAFMAGEAAGNGLVLMSDKIGLTDGVGDLAGRGYYGIRDYFARHPYTNVISNPMRVGY